MFNVIFKDFVSVLSQACTSPSLINMLLDASSLLFLSPPSFLMMLFLTLKDKNKVREKIHRDQQSLTRRYILRYIRAFSIAGLVSKFFLGMFYSKTLPLGHLCIAIPLMWSTLSLASCFALPELLSCFCWAHPPEMLPFRMGCHKFPFMSPSCCSQDKGLSATFQLGSTPLYSVARQTIQVSLLVLNFSWWGSDTNVCMSQTVWNISLVLPEAPWNLFLV